MPKSGIKDPKTGKFRPTVKYTFYRRKVYDNKAPSYVDLQNYKEIGYTRALFLKEAVREWMSSEDLELRPPRFGDLIYDSFIERYYILTPTYIWAIVEVKK